MPADTGAIRELRRLILSARPQLSIALRAAAAGIHPDEAAAGLIIGHAASLQRGDFTRHIETAACASDGTPMTWIDWDAVIPGLDRRNLELVTLAIRRAAGQRP